jgi:hypothetical protein
MRDLRHHPLLLFIELHLLFGIAAIVVLHVTFFGKVAPTERGDRAFAEPIVESAAPPLLRLHERMVVDVAAEFDRHEIRALDDAGGYAMHVPERFPSHIFRKNPSDRVPETAKTPGDDFFLEDAYEEVRNDPFEDGRDPYRATLSPDGNHRVYVIDGNLWVHNHHTMSLSIAARDGPARVTFVVLGDIYFLDSFFYGGPGDAVLFVAVPDHEGNGGAVWLGDTSYGTLARVDGWLYAGSDVLGDDLDTPTVVNGGLAAAGQVRVRQQNEGCHKRTLEVRFDARLTGGRGWVPGL